MTASLRSVFALFSNQPDRYACLFLQVDFLQLQMNTLRRYKRHYKLQLKPGTNKIQLVEVQLYVCNNWQVGADLIV